MNQLTLDSVQRDFKAWRTLGSKKGKIPDCLWDKTLKLIEQHPIGKVVMALGLSGGQVAARRKKHKLNATAVTAMPLGYPLNFVELKMPLRPATTSDSFNKLEIKRADGAVLAIERLTEQTLLQVLTQFTQGR